MAEVWLGREAAAPERTVAIKILDAKSSRDADLRGLFLDEARIAQRLDHPNVATVLDAGAAGDRRYLVLEYVDGLDLRGLLAACHERGLTLSYEVGLSIIMQAAAGLDHAHRRCDEQGRPLRLVHRDVSLSNLMIDRHGLVKVVDFGIARSTLSTVHTSPGVVRGKASYMSPEQCRGLAIDHRADVFALGIVLYEVTTGARCFAGDNDFDRMSAVVSGDYLPPSSVVAEFPADLEAVIRTALATDPAKRYASCAALIEALQGVMDAHGWRAGREGIARAIAAACGRAASGPRASRTQAIATADIVDVHDAAPTETSSTVVDRPRHEPRLARGSIADFRTVDPKLCAAFDDQITRGRRLATRPRVSVHASRSGRERRA